MVDLLRLVATLRSESRAYAELLSIALNQIYELNAELDRVRDNYHRLLDARRAEKKPRADADFPGTPAKRAA